MADGDGVDVVSMSMRTDDAFGVRNMVDEGGGVEYRRV